ncbi:MAG: hypothetical protein MUC63_04415 [Planctomycetes bacterium]|jgi:hypothetical protein|nr:hypothetical protein [Planctomycetota bacterium]
MWKEIWHRLSGRTTPHATPETAVRVVKNVPALPDPILVFMELPAVAVLLSGVPSWKTVHVRSAAEFEEALPRCRYSMLIAGSPASESGAAGKAILAFRKLNPEALAVCYGMDYRLSVSGPHALACKADVLLLGGMIDGDVVYCLGTAVLVKRRNGIDPSLDFYRKLLELTAAESPFWGMQEFTGPPAEIE